LRPNGIPSTTSDHVDLNEDERDATISTINDSTLGFKENKIKSKRKKKDKFSAANQVRMQVEKQKIILIQQSKKEVKGNSTLKL